MLKFLKQGGYFIRNNLSIFFSLFLLIVIPLTFYYNTFSILRSFQKNIDLVTQSKTLLAESIFNVFANDIISSHEVLQDKVDQISEENSEIVELQIILLEGEEFKVISSKKHEEIGDKITEDTVSLAWHSNQAIAHLTSRDGERFWEVIKPIQDSKGGKVGLVNMGMSLNEIDAGMVEAVKRAYVFTIIAICLALFLIMHHTRLFRYVVSFRKLKEKSMAKDDFINMAIHELRNPITNIRNYILTLKEEITPSLDERQKQYLFAVLVSSERLSGLVDDILDVVKIQQGKLSFESEKLSPRKIIGEIVKEMRTRAEKKNLQLIFEEKEDLFFVRANQNRLKEVLANLIGNAIKYTPEGKVEIETEVNKIRKKYFITVQDTGMGISAENQKKLFSKFYRVKSEETAEIPGTGLGLWIIKQMCEKMGGEILFESMKGSGSKFIIILPLDKE